MTSFVFKITSALLHRIRKDLARPHNFAFERVGFITARVGAIPSGVVILASDYHPVQDSDYLEDPTVGAMMGPRAIGSAMEIAYKLEVGVFHVHIHDHRGKPQFSRTDLTETARFVPDFFKVRPHLPHGAIVLSKDSATGLCWHPQCKKPFRFHKFSFVGLPTVLVREIANERI
jgi:hypothetical protein